MLLLVMRKKAKQYMLVLKVVDQIRFGKFSCAFTKIFLDISRLGYKIVKELQQSQGRTQYQIHRIARLSFITAKYIGKLDFSNSC